MKYKGTRFLVRCPDKFVLGIFVKDLQDSWSNCTVVSFDSDEDFIAEVNRGSLFGDDRRIIVLENLREDSLESLVSLFQFQIEDILVFCDRGLTSRSKHLVTFRTMCTSIDMLKVSEDETRRWLCSYMVDMGLKYDPSLPNYLIQVKQNDLQAIDNELYKLKALFSDSEISLRDAARVIVPYEKESFFEFGEHFFHRRTQKCLTEFYKVGSDKYTQVIHYLFNTLDKLVKVADYRKEGKKIEDIAAYVGLSQYVLKNKYYTVLAIRGKGKLLQLYEILGELDLKLRSLSIDKQALFETYLLRSFKI